MPEQNVTTKFKVDISDLKKGIADANKSIKLANAEFKNATAGLDDWSKSADGLTAKIKQQNSVVDAEKKKLDLLKQQLDRLNKSQQDGEKIIKDLTAKYDSAVKTYGATSDEAKKYAKQLADAQAAQERNTKAAEDLNIKILNQDTAVKNAAAQVGKYETALDELKRSEDDAAKASGDLDKSVGDVDDASGKAAKGGIDTFKVALGNLAADAISFVIDKLRELGGAVKDAFLEFDEGRDAVIKATGATGAAADELTKSYANVSKTVVGEFDDIGSALGEVNTRFGYTGKELEDATAQFLKFADITGTDATTAVQLVSRAMGDAGINSDEYASVLDQLTIAAQASGISVDKLTENLTKYGAPMRALGFDTQESIAIFSQWEKAGVNTEIAFSGMKKAISNWSAEGKDAKEEFKKTLDQIAAAPDIASATTQAIEVFGQKAGPDLADAIQAGRFEYSDFLDIIQGSEGTVAKTYDETQSGADKAKLAIQNMKTTAAELANTFMEKYGPQIESAIEKITGLLEKWAPKIEKGIQWIIDNLPGIEALVVGIGAAFAAWKVAGIISAVTTALAGMSAAEVVAAAKTWLLNTALLANPIGLIIAAIAGLVAAFVVLWKKSDKFREFWKNLWENIKKAAKVVIDAVVNFFSGAWDKIKAVWSKVSEFFKKLWDGVKAIFSAYINFVINYFKTAWEIIKAIWGAVTEFFSNIWEGIKSIFSGVVNWFKEKFETAWLTIKFIWSAVTDFFSGIWDGIKETFSAVGDWFSEKFQNAVDRIKTVFSAVKNFFSGVWDNIKGVFGNVADWFKDKFATAWQKVKDVFSTGGKIFEGIKDGILNGLKAVINALIRGINKVIKVPFDGINWALRKIRDISILGVEPFKWIDEIGVPQIPELAKGGIVKKRSFIAGEDGEEAVVPLEKNTGGLRKIAGMLVEDMKKSGAIIKGNDGSQTVNNYNFTQNNTSPKALSRYDIYRQTKNLINAAKGV